MKEEKMLDEPLMFFGDQECTEECEAMESAVAMGELRCESGMRELRRERSCCGMGKLLEKGVVETRRLCPETWRSVPDGMGVGGGDKKKWRVRDPTKILPVAAEHLTLQNDEQYFDFDRKFPMWIRKPNDYI